MLTHRRAEQTRHLWPSPETKGGPDLSPLKGRPPPPEQARTRVWFDAKSGRARIKYAPGGPKAPSPPRPTAVHDVAFRGVERAEEIPEWRPRRPDVAAASERGVSELLRHDASCEPHVAKRNPSLAPGWSEEEPPEPRGRRHLAEPRSLDEPPAYRRARGAGRPAGDGLEAQ